MVQYDRVATTSSSDNLGAAPQHSMSVSTAPLDGSPSRPTLTRRTNSQQRLEDTEGEGSFDEENAGRSPTNGALSPSHPGSLSPRPIYPTTLGAMYNGPSFDLDDDDDEDDIDLSRYHLDFKSTDRRHALSNGSLYPSSSGYGRRFSFCQWLWHKFQSARQRARERRAQLLLQHTDPSWRQSTWIFIMTLCDATDRGIFLVATFLVAWILTIVLIQHRPVARRNVIIVGSAFFVVRLGTRPLFEYCVRQRLKRRQSSLQPIPQNSPTFRAKRSVTGPSGDPSSLYLNRQMNDSNGNTSMTDLELATMQRTAKEELPPDLQLTDSNESDPMIAAI